MESSQALLVTEIDCPARSAFRDEDSRSRSTCHLGSTCHRDLPLDDSKRGLLHGSVTTELVARWAAWKKFAVPKLYPVSTATMTAGQDEDAAAQRIPLARQARQGRTQRLRRKVQGRRPAQLCWTRALVVLGAGRRNATHGQDEKATPIMPSIENHP